MKNTSLAIHGISLVLIAALFVMYFNLKKSISGDGGASMNTSIGQKGNLKIVYVDADSINANYKLMKQFKDEVQQQQAALQAEYENKGRKLQEEYESYQQKAQSGNISQLEAQKVQQDLQSKKAEIDEIQHRQEELVKEVQDKNVAIQLKIDNYVAQMNKKLHYDYVLGYTSAGGSVMLVNDSLDITRMILQGLNKEYTDSIQKAGAKH